MKIEWKGLEISASVTDGIAGDTVEGVAFYWDAADIRLAAWDEFVDWFSLEELQDREEWRQNEPAISGVDLCVSRRKTDRLPVKTRDWIETDYRDEIDAALLQEWRAMREEAV